MDDDVAGTAQTALIEAIRELREQVAQLAERISSLETAAGAAAPAVVQPAPAPEISEELVLVISAAIAAFLGKKPYIRQIRLISSPTWSHQGRVSVQASHALKHYRAGASA
jgi:methylmalonyl-CoA carboxyltransferase large subunit